MNQLFLRFKIWMLNKRIFGGRRWYQFIEFSQGITTEKFCGPKGVERTKSFEEWLDGSTALDNSDVVLDLGSNPSWLSILLSSRVSRVKAVEIDSGFARQARFVVNYFGSRLQCLKGVSLFECDINNRLDLLDDATVVLASKFFYHKDFSADIDKFMTAMVNSPVRAVIVQGHVTQGELGGEAGMTEFFAGYGFDYHGGLGGTAEYPIGVANRTT